MNRAMPYSQSQGSQTQSEQIDKYTPLIVCCDNTERQVQLCAQLAADFEDITACSLKQLPAQLQAQPNACIVASWHKPCGELAWVIEFSAQQNTPLLVFTQMVSSSDLHSLPTQEGYALLPLGLTDNLSGWLQYALNLRQHALEQAKQIDKLNQKLDDRKYVDKAKGLLMKLHNLDEEQAYQALRTSAMKNSQTLGQVAKNLISTLENLSL
ncbi:ANTAR domain-containing response regulator [Vibrio gangliei]|uniref:ANTAR domain-containing response regulator n=1 Tax=Vibrio gangliei TaxID=2077090 RepID=UPI0013005DC9|nr:ANTAR domain-containing protein [Vibrio gangliei]